MLIKFIVLAKLIDSSSKITKIHDLYIRVMKGEFYSKSISKPFESDRLYTHMKVFGTIWLIQTYEYNMYTQK